MTTRARKHDWLIVHHPHGEKLADLLHSVPEGDSDDDRQFGFGSAKCGLTTTWEAPGLYQTMGLIRCPDCCDLLGVPRGQGVVANGSDEPS